jgi:hypothetical protein
MKEILSNVIEIILAEHYPAVLSIFPHWNPPELILQAIATPNRLRRQFPCFSAQN